MKGIIFDLDGVLVNSMPTHVKAWQITFKKVAGIDVEKREIYLLEGMRGKELVKKLFKQKQFSKHSLAKEVNDHKDRVFKKIHSSKPFEGVKKMIKHLDCKKAIVSGSAKKDVETILEVIGKKNFDVIITADDITKGKPDPSAFQAALRKMHLDPKDAVVVENAPLGARAANNANIECIVVLNNTPLKISDFKSLVPKEKIFENTKSINQLLTSWCK